MGGGDRGDGETVPSAEHGLSFAVSWCGSRIVGGLYFRLAEFQKIVDNDGFCIC